MKKSMGLNGVRASSTLLSARKLSPLQSLISDVFIGSEIYADPMLPIQPRKRTFATGNTMAHAGTSVDRRDEDQESQHGTFLGPGLGLEGLILETCKVFRDIQ